MQRNAIYGLQVLFGLLFLVAGSAKLAGLDVMVHQFDMIGLGQWFRVLAGSLEIIGALCLFVPRTALFGAVLIGCLMMGATGAMVGRVAMLPGERAVDSPLPVAAKTYRA